MLRRYFYILCIWYFRTLCDRHGEGLFSVILKKKKIPPDTYTAEFHFQISCNLEI